VVPFLPGAAEIRSRRDLENLMKKSLAPSDLDLTAFHPLGTCRIGTDPEMSVLSPEHETHGVESLYVADGSAIPSSLGVNPQLTSMAMAHRAGEAIDARLG
jgi:choline dehydrogenase-like flavoprotein